MLHKRERKRNGTEDVMGRPHVARLSFPAGPPFAWLRRNVQHERPLPWTGNYSFGFPLGLELEQGSQLHFRRMQVNEGTTNDDSVRCHILTPADLYTLHWGWQRKKWNVHTWCKVLTDVNAETSGKIKQRWLLIRRVREKTYIQREKTRDGFAVLLKPKNPVLEFKYNWNMFKHIFCTYFKKFPCY